MVWNYHCCRNILGYFVAQRALVKAGLHKDTLVDIIFYSALFGFIHQLLLIILSDNIRGKSK